MVKKFRVRKTNKFHYYTLQANNIRRLWSAEDPERKKCLINARVRDGKIFKERCNDCQQLFPYGQYQVDHITPIAISQPQTKEELDIFYQRTLVKANQLQVLCLNCHYDKTNREFDDRKNEKKEEKI